MSGNKRKQWRITIGEPFDSYRGSVDMSHIGTFCSESFFTKAEAEKSVKAKENYQVWHYHAVKFIPKRSLDGSQ